MPQPSSSTRVIGRDIEVPLEQRHLLIRHEAEGIAAATGKHRKPLRHIETAKIERFHKSRHPKFQISWRHSTNLPSTRSTISPRRCSA